ncbi:DNA-binding protein [Cordyceps javanica]|uniref:DNA-binding protein n=1 Tax=Cordyceps javanica TaxID=43265 RepID=A0A545V1A4_9HYPO|nr:DNA-binding protein [Cordyceps javanica]TQW07333.1 DNA-binding protein [Cordyceps javanica]
MERLRTVAAYFWNFRYLPMKYRWPLIKLRRRLFPSRSPLELRCSIRYARSIRYPPVRSPSLFVLGLLWPLPTWKFAAELPQPPRLIAAHPESVDQMAHDVQLLRLMPLWRSRDTPLRSAYRIYEAVCARDGDLIASEAQYFWGQESWATADIPEPPCRQNEEQFAVMAATVETLVECFNWRIEMGLRRNDPLFNNAYKEPPPAQPEVCPSWTSSAGTLPEELVLGSRTTYIKSPFNRRNIHFTTGDFYSV